MIEPTNCLELMLKALSELDDVKELRYQRKGVQSLVKYQGKKYLITIELAPEGETHGKPRYN